MVRFEAVVLLLIAVLAMAVRGPLAAVPLERDEGEYALLAQRWLRHGEPPYLVHFDQKPPGAIAAYAIHMAAFGESPTALHWGVQLHQLAAQAGVWAVARRWGGLRTGLLACAIAVPLFTDRNVLGQSANTEAFMLAPLAWGLAFALRSADTGAARWAALSGACFAAAALCKQVALPNTVVALGVGWIGTHRVRRTAAYVGGGLALAGPVVAYFHAVGAGPAFWDCVVGHNLRYATSLTMTEALGNAAEAFGELFVTTIPVFALLALAPLGPWRRASDGWVAAAWLAASLAGVSGGGYFRAHYLLQLMPALAPLAGMGAASLVDRAAARWRTLTAVAVAVGPLVWCVAANPWYYLPGDPLAKCDMLYGGCPFSESPAVGEFIAARTSPADSIYVFGSESQLYYYAARRPAGRYIFAYPLMTAFPDTAERQVGELAAFDAASPRLVIVAHSEQSFLEGPRTPPAFRAGIERRLSERYRPVAMVRHAADGRRIETAIALTPGELLAGRYGDEFPVSLTIWELK